MSGDAGSHRERTSGSLRIAAGGELDPIDVDLRPRRRQNDRTVRRRILGAWRSALNFYAVTERRFRMQEAFPESDEVARFVVGLGLINNECHRMMQLMPKDDPPDATDEVRGVRLMLGRQQAATCREAIDFIVGAQRHYPRIGNFIEGLGIKAREAYRQINEAADPRSPYHLPWLAEQRHVTFHVPRLHQHAYEHGNDAIANALKKAGPEEGVVFEEDSAGSVQYGFADIASVQMLPWADPNAMEHLSRARLALSAFTHEAVEAYLRSLPRGVVKTVAG